MQGAQEPAAELTRRYRRLLVAYPRAYQRHRGEELVDTLLEAAPPGRRRPGLRETANLARAGLRCRLGRPASRWVVVLAVLTALALGMLGAATGCRLAWQTAGPLPDDARVAQIVRTALPDGLRGPSGYRQDGLFNGPDYAPGSVTRAGWQPATADLPSFADRIMARLRTAGWQTSSPRITGNNACFGGWWGSSCNPADRYLMLAFTARKGPLVVSVQASRVLATGDTPSAKGTRFDLTLNLYRATPPLVEPAEVAAGLAAALVGWLLFGWLSRRTETRSGPTRIAVLVLAASTGLFWAVPVLIATAGTLYAAVDTVIVGLGLFQHNDRWVPNDLSFLFVPPFGWLMALGALTALAAPLLALVARPATAPTTPTTG